MHCKSFFFISIMIVVFFGIVLHSYIMLIATPILIIVLSPEKAVASLAEVLLVKEQDHQNINIARVSNR